MSANFRKIVDFIPIEFLFIENAEGEQYFVKL